MGSVLIWFLLGGVGLYTLSKLAGGGDDAMTVKRVYGDGRLDRYGAVARKEKFQDSMYLVFGVPDKPYTIAPLAGRPHDYIGQGLNYFLNRSGYFEEDKNDRVDVGYEYFSEVPNTGKDRIAAIRSVMANRRSRPTEFRQEKSVILQQMYQNSEKELVDMGYKLAAKYKQIASDVKTASDYADRLGVDVAALQSEANALLETGKGGVKLVSETLKTYGPIAQVIINNVSLAYDAAFGGGGHVEQAAKWTELASSLAVYIPYVGALFSSALSMSAAALRSELEKNLARCVADQDRAKDAIDRATTLQMPIPWHGYQIFPADCGEDNMPTRETASLVDLYERNAIVWKSFADVAGAASLLGVRRWWAYVSLYASHPEVKDVFDLLGYDASGGVIASDEQVMLVATPVAVAYGIPVDDFAIALWNKCDGWKKSSVFEDDALVDKWSRDFCPDGCRIPTISWWAQWVDLCDAAFVLADGWTRSPTLKTIDPLILTNMTSVLASGGSIKIPTRF